MYLTACPPRGPDSIPSHGIISQRIFPWLITLCQPVLSQRGRKWHKDTTQPVDSDVQGQSSTLDRRWLNKTLPSSLAEVPPLIIMNDNTLPLNAFEGENFTEYCTVYKANLHSDIAFFWYKVGCGEKYIRHRTPLNSV